MQPHLCSLTPRLSCPLLLLVLVVRPIPEVGLRSPLTRIFEPDGLAQPIQRSCISNIIDYNKIMFMNTLLRPKAEIQTRNQMNVDSSPQMRLFVYNLFVHFLPHLISLSVLLS